MTDLFDLSGKVALITGSTRGIGRAIAEAMAARGARVVISSRKPEACERVAGEIGAAAVPIACNISDDAAIEALVEACEARLGPPDILVCNAAVNPYMGPFLDTPDDAFDKTIAVNIRANMRLCRRVIPGMQARRDGAIVVVSSIAAFKGSEHLGLYAVTKAADTQIVRNLAVENGRYASNLTIEMGSEALAEVEESGVTISEVDLAPFKEAVMPVYEMLDLTSEAEMVKEVLGQ